MKRGLFFFALALCLSCLSQDTSVKRFFSGPATSGTSLTSGLAAYWAMDAIVSSSIADATGNGETLTTHGAVSVTSPGLFVNYLNGSGSTGNYASRADDSTMGIGAGKSFTISGWYQAGGLGANEFFIGKWNSTDTSLQDYAIRVNQDNGWTFSAVNLAGTVVIVTNSIHVNIPPSSGAPNQWANICAGYDDANQYIWIQIGNGARLIAPCVGVRRTSVAFTIGNDASATVAGPRSDEVGFWTRVLTPQEVANIVNPTTINLTPGIAYPLTVTTPGIAAPIGTTNISQWVACLVHMSADHSSGNYVSNEVLKAVVTFWNGVLADGLTGKYKAVNVMAPDNVVDGNVGGGSAFHISSFPIYDVHGISYSATWGSFGGFGPMPRSCTLNGMAWDGNGGISELYVTDIVPSTDFASQTSSGMSVYVWTNHGDQFDAAANGGTTANLIVVNRSGTYQFQNGSASGNNITASVATPPPLGFYSDNRISSTDHRVFFANSGTAFAQYGSTDSTSFTGTLSGNAIRIFWDWVTGGNGSERISYFSVHDGFTSSEAQKEYNRVQQMRIDIGGGSH